MWSTVKELLKSKKFLVALTALTVWSAGRAGLDLDKDELLGAVTPLWTFVLAQGVADHGKGKALAEAASKS